jgi:type VI secretion system protein ImpJ
VLVTQHHFQQQDRYHEQLLWERVRAVAHYDWGILELQIDPAALATGRFRLLRLSAVWPDGAAVDCGGLAEAACPEARSFDTAWAPETRALPVFVGLSQDTPARPLVGETGEEQATGRYLAALRSVRDANGGPGDVELEWARPNLRLFFADEPQDGYTTLRIAEIVRDASGTALLRDNYVPPVLRLASSPFLLNGLHRVLTVAIAKQRELAAERAQRHPGQIEYHATAAQRFWLLHTLNGAIPGLRHLLDTAHAHPEELYLALLGLAGQLASFSSTADPASLPKFDYLGLGGSFEELFARLLVLLSTPVELPYREVPLERRSDGIYLGRLAEAGSLELFVALTANLTDAVLRDRAPKLLKLADWTQIYDVVKQARHAVRMEVEWQPSAALPLEPGTCFLRVRKDGSFWKGIERSGTIALYLPLDAEWSGASLRVYAIDPKYLT